MTGDRLTRAMTTVAVLLVAAIAAIVSYVHIRQLALAHGGDSLTAALLPLLIDGTVAAMSGFMLTAARDEARDSIPSLARFMLVLSVGATLAANTAFGAAYGVTGALLWTLPAVMFVGCVEVSVLMVRKTRPATGISTNTAMAGALTSSNGNPVMHNRRSEASTNDGSGPAIMTVAQQAALLGRSPSQVARYRRDGSIDRRLAAASENGKLAESASSLNNRARERIER